MAFISVFLLYGSYWIDFSKWEVFVNDDATRTFLSMEVVTGGLPEVKWSSYLVPLT